MTRQHPLAGLAPVHTESVDRPTPFLSQIELEYGPPEVLGRFFLRGDEAALARDVHLSLVTYQEFADCYRQLAPEWPLLSIFRCEEWDAPETDFIHLIGRNGKGQAVATQAARLFRWSGTSLREEAQSLRLFHGRTEPLPGARCIVTAPAAAQITGSVAYSGGGWYRPDVRRQKLSAILPRISRALALTRWNTAYTVTFAERPLVEKGLPKQYGYSRIEDNVLIENVIGPHFEGALSWMPVEELVVDLTAFSRDFHAQVDAIIENGSGKQNATRVTRG